MARRDVHPALAFHLIRDFYRVQFASVEAAHAREWKEIAADRELDQQPTEQVDPRYDPANAVGNMTAFKMQPMSGRMEYLLYDSYDYDIRDPDGLWEEVEAHTAKRQEREERRASRARILFAGVGILPFVAGRLVSPA